MDKDKLIQMIDDYSYMENLSGSKYGYMADLPRDVFEDLVDRQENIRREIYSKPVMPKVFDDFAEHFNLEKQQEHGCLDDALTIIFEMYMYGGVGFKDLEEYMRDHTDEMFYAKCVDALVNGYEVE